MKSDILVDVTDPRIAVDRQKTGIMLRFEIVEGPKGGRRRSGKFANLYMTPTMAMFLLAGLQSVQKACSFAQQETVAEAISLPRPKKRAGHYGKTLLSLFAATVPIIFGYRIGSTEIPRAYRELKLNWADGVDSFALLPDALAFAGEGLGAAVSVVLGVTLWWRQLVSRESA
jgi:hypothetical protein